MTVFDTEQVSIICHVDANSEQWKRDKIPQIKSIGPLFFSLCILGITYAV